MNNVNVGQLTAVRQVVQTDEPIYDLDGEVPRSEVDGGSICYPKMPLDDIIHLIVCLQGHRGSQDPDFMRWCT